MINQATKHLPSQTFTKPPMINQAIYQATHNNNLTKYQDKLGLG